MPDGGTVLVTAVGGDIGWSVARILRGCGYFDRVLGCDVASDHAGRAVVDGCFVVPRAGDPAYLDALLDLVVRERVEYVVPISEPEIERIFQATLEGWHPVRLVMAQGRAIPIGLDKLATAMFLGEIGVPAPWTIPSTDGLPPEFPCVLKDRRGWGNKNVVLLEDEEALRFHVPRRPDSVLQQLLLPAEEEYTCGVFRSRTGEVRTIVFRRRLMGGITGSGVVVQDAAIDHVLRTVATALELRGSINVQLRRTSAGPTIFEINARFSSTVMFRDLLGFHDVVWSVDDLEGRDVEPYAPPVGTRVYRVFSEIVQADPVSPPRRP